MLKAIVPRPGALAALAVAAASLVGCGNQSAPSLVAAAKVKLEQADPKAAVIELKNALQQSPQMPEARFLLGKALLGEGKPADALLELEKARDLKYSDNEVLPVLAQALLAMRQPKG